MEERRKILDYLAHVMVIFGFTMTVMMCFTVLFGESAEEISSLYILGKRGISIETMAQLLGVSVIITFLRYLFFTNRIIKNLTVVIRTVWMVGCILVIMCGFIVAFHWFPIHMWQPWALFFLCFGISFVVSTILTYGRTRLENKQLEEGLEKMKKKWKEQDGNEY